MTQAEREQQARDAVETLLSQDVCLSEGECDIVQRLILILLADTERATLELVASETRRFTSGGAVAQWCKQQAKEVKP